MSMELSREQQLAVKTLGANLLVSAAAGAGKTFVLVERVLHLLMHAEPPHELEQLLVVTFTRAAAREMKDRIGNRLRAFLEARPDHHHLQRQLALLERAPIGTIDAFCQELVRENFHVLGINPGFSVLSNEEGRLIWRDAIDAVFESHYADATARGAEFRQLVEAFGGRTQDEKLEHLIRKIADFLRITENPRAWKDQLDGALEETRGANLTSMFWGRQFRDLLDRKLASIAGRMESAMLLATKQGLNDPALLEFIEKIRAAVGHARHILSAGGFDGWMTALLDDSIPKTVPRKSPKMPPGEAEVREELCKQFVKPAYADFKALCQFEARYSAAEWLGGIRASKPLVHRLLALTDEVLHAFAEQKQRLNALDFNDIERMTLQALQDPKDPGEPGPIARLYRDRFAHVLVDEYQDINELQAAILRLVSRQDDEQGRAPNLFAVGDVKQSIYGFRLADPDFFIRRYTDSTPLDAEVELSVSWNYRLDLPKNYRCRRTVVESANATFRMLMEADIGGIAYDTASELVCARAAVEPPPDLPTRKNPDFVPTELLLVDPKASLDGPNDDPAGNEAAVAANTADTAVAAESREAGAESDADAPLPGDAEDSLAGAEVEAYALAGRLWEIVGRRGDGGDAALWVHAPDPDVPGSTPIYRPARWIDIVILLRAAKEPARTLIPILRRQGIPVVESFAPGFLSTPEAFDILGVLRLLDNPCQDIPLAAHLRSPLCRFSDDDLARIRIASPDGDFYATLNSFAAAGDDAELAARCRAVLGRLDRWRELVRQLPIPDFLDLLLQETAYRHWAAMQPDGARRVATLEAIRSRALQFNQFARRGLARFLHFMDTLDDSDDPSGTTVAPMPEENAVRILSVHRSKGLEFPIVVLANLSRKFNWRDLREPVVVDRKALVGMKTPAGKRNVILPSLNHEVVVEQRRRATLAEELRLLYVAMTRAREHLILSAAVAKPAEALERWAVWKQIGGGLPAWMRFEANSHLDWLGPVAAAHGCLVAAPLETPAHDAPSLDPAAPAAMSPFHIRIIDRVSRAGESQKQNTLYDRIETIAETRSPAQCPDSPDARVAPAAGKSIPAWLPAAGEALRRVQSIELEPVSPELRPKLSVTEIKRLWDYAVEPQDASENLVPQESSAAAALRDDPYALRLDDAAPERSLRLGTLTHLFLRHVDLRRCATLDEINAQLRECRERGILPTQPEDCIGAESIRWFFETDLGRRLRAHPEAFERELPFTASLTADEINPELPPARHVPPGEEIVVQGIFDGLLRDADGLTLLDYKTDRVTGAAIEERTRLYAVQLRLYARAAQKAYGLPVRQRLLVYLHPRLIIPVP